MKFNLSDNGLHLTFAPMSLTRPIGDIRMGLFTNKERYQMYLPDAEIGFLTEAYLSKKFNSVHSALTVNANVIPNEDLIAAISNLENNQSLILEGYMIASYGDGNEKVKFVGKASYINGKMEYFSVQSPGIETRFHGIYGKQNKSKTFIYKYANR